MVCFENKLVEAQGRSMQRKEEMSARLLNFKRNGVRSKADRPPRSSGAKEGWRQPRVSGREE